MNVHNHEDIILGNRTKIEKILSRKLKVAINLGEVSDSIMEDIKYLINDKDISDKFEGLIKFLTTPHHGDPNKYAKYSSEILKHITEPIQPIIDLPQEQMKPEVCMKSRREPSLMTSIFEPPKPTREFNIFNPLGSLFACILEEEVEERLAENQKEEEERQREHEEWEKNLSQEEREEIAEMNRRIEHRRNMALTCKFCKKMAWPIDGTGNRYRCGGCGRQFAGAPHGCE